MDAPPPIVVVAVDSFKGSLAADDACAAIAARHPPRAARRRRARAADGRRRRRHARRDARGVGGERRMLSVRRRRERRGAKPPTRPARATAARSSRSRRSSASPTPSAWPSPVAERDTRGMGEAIRALLDVGVRALFRWRSAAAAPTMAAPGCSSALGLRLFDARTTTNSTPIADGACRSSRVSTLQALDARLRDARIHDMSDVDNPLTRRARRDRGVRSAKRRDAGAGDATSTRPLRTTPISLEAGARQRTARDNPGAGAAGGLGFALHMLGARFEPGAEVVARHDRARRGARRRELG